MSSRELQVEAALKPQERPGPAGGKRARNRELKAQALGEAALGLFLERGIEGVTIDDITRLAGVAKGSFYRYFQDREALVDALLEPARVRVLAAFDSAEARLRKSRSDTAVRNAYLRLGKELAAALMAWPDVTRLYLQECKAPPVGGRLPVHSLAEMLMARALTLTTVAYQRGKMGRVHPQVSTLAVVGAAERMLHAHFGGQLQVHPMQAMQELVGIVLDGMRKGT